MIESTTIRTILGKDIEKLSEEEIEQSIRDNILRDAIVTLEKNIETITVKKLLHINQIFRENALKGVRLFQYLLQDIRMQK